MTVVERVEQELERLAETGQIPEDVQIQRVDDQARYIRHSLNNAITAAAGGALLNAVFVQHYQDMAFGHFTVRRLERKYGVEPVHRAYSRLDRSARPPRQPVLRSVG